MFRQFHRDSKTLARTGVLKTRHGKVETPFFMPVETKGAAKFVSQEELKKMGAKAFISNSLLLYLKPGLNTIQQHGGLHQFVRWNNTIFTDSGGFQVLSEHFVDKITDDGVWFRSPFDGSKHFLSPKKSMEIQQSLGSDVAMCLDDVPLAGASVQRLNQSMQRTLNWAKICLENRSKKQLLFGISQGGVNQKLRVSMHQKICEMGFDGIAIGGVTIGEPKSEMAQVTKWVSKVHDPNKPLYLMGLGSPTHLLESIGMGCDLFDSAYPTRHARHGNVLTRQGEIFIGRKTFEHDLKPIDKDCDCMVCQEFSRSYLHHLFRVKEPNGFRLLSHHNLHFLQQLMKESRVSIKENRFGKFQQSFVKSFKAKK